MKKRRGWPVIVGILIVGVSLLWGAWRTHEMFALRRFIAARFGVPETQVLLPSAGRLQIFGGQMEAYGSGGEYLGTVFLPQNDALGRPLIASVSPDDDYAPARIDTPLSPAEAQAVANKVINELLGVPEADLRPYEIGSGSPAKRSTWVVPVTLVGRHPWLYPRYDVIIDLQHLIAITERPHT
jgi:hypothetical protein